MTDRRITSSPNNNKERIDTGVDENNQSKDDDNDIPKSTTKSINEYDGTDSSSSSNRRGNNANGNSVTRIRPGLFLTVIFC